MESLTSRQEEEINAIKGISSAIRYRTGRLPDSNCPLLKSELKDISALADSLAIMARMTV